MNHPSAWLGNSRAGRIIAVLILLGFVVFLVRVWVFDRYDLTVEIVEADVPLYCQRASRGLFGRVPAERDFVPADADYDYCGLVWTDHGPFKLPYSSAWPVIQDSRAEILEPLRANCSYIVSVIGTGERPTTDPDQLRKAGTIIRLEASLPCDV